VLLALGDDPFDFGLGEAGVARPLGLEPVGGAPAERRERRRERHDEQLERTEKRQDPNGEIVGAAAREGDADLGERPVGQEGAERPERGERPARHVGRKRLGHQHGGEGHADDATGQPPGLLGARVLQVTAEAGLREALGLLVQRGHAGRVE
jgi:hypothetical protein